MIQYIILRISIEHLPISSFRHFPYQSQELEDMPAGSDAGFVVTPSRPGQYSCCLRCCYIHRGSFKSTSLSDLTTQIQQHGQLKEKFLAVYIRAWQLLLICSCCISAFMFRLTPSPHIASCLDTSTWNFPRMLWGSAKGVTLLMEKFAFPGLGISTIFDYSILEIITSGYVACMDCMDMDFCPLPWKDLYHRDVLSYMDTSTSFI